jgi:hypothetical protein
MLRALLKYTRGRTLAANGYLPGKTMMNSDRGIHACCSVRQIPMFRSFHSSARFLLVMLVLAAPLQSRADQLRVYTVDGLTRVGRLEAAQEATSIAIEAGRNEYEPFQIVIHAGSNGLAGVQIQISELHGPHHGIIHRENLAAYHEHYLEVIKPSPKSKGGAGWYPDALLPLGNAGASHNGKEFVSAPFAVPPDSNQPLWVDVFVPKDAAPGRYSGSVSVSARNQKAVQLPIRLTVWNFRLPDTPSMRSNFGGFSSQVAKAHHLDGNSPEFRALERRYAEALAAHRICPSIPGDLMPEILADGSIDARASHNRLKEWIETFHVTGFQISLQGNDPLGKERELNVRYLQSIYAYLKTNGWEKLAYIYVLDEPNDAAAYEQVRQRGKFIHETQPGIKVLCTEQPTPQDPAWGTLVGSVDIWVPLWPLFEEKAAAERLKAGDELWSYTALCQGEKGKDTPYWELDFPLLDYRIPAWMNWRFGVNGLLYWSTVYWEKAGDVWTNATTYVEGSEPFNGEGSLFYPGVAAGLDGPIASMRLKQIREGMEDYEYLHLLAEHGEKEFADQCSRRLAEGWTRWDENPADLLALRRQMGERLSELFSHDR